MSDEKVIQLRPGDEYPEIDPEVIERMVDKLNELLTLARSGQLISLAIVSELSDGPNSTLTRGWDGLVSMSLVGTMDVLKAEIMEAWSHPRD